MKPGLQRLFHEYHAYHRDPVNVAIHKVAIPAILFHVVVMLDWVGLGATLAGQEVTLGVVLVVLAGAWYVAMSPRYALVVVPFAVGCLWLGRATPRPWVVAIAIVAWVLQLVGHARFERRAPAFKDNLLQLLVGPAYVVALLMGDWPPGEPAPSDDRSHTAA
ncbi:MAG: Mpo1-like protein [Planctomycetota bacterium]